MPKANDVQRGRMDPTRRLQRKLYRAAKQSRTRRFHALYDKVHRTDILWRAWQEVAKKRGAPGVDAASIEAIEAEGVEDFLNELRAELTTEVYRPLPVRRVMIPKRTGGERPLGVPTVRDRVVQTATKLVVEPIFEADFADCSYGFRPKRSALQAREHIRRELQWGRRWVVDADIKGFLETASQCPLVHVCGLKRSGCWSMTLMHKPFLLPQRTWTAASSPRLTRCNTVWRDTPRRSIASRMGK